MRRNATCSWNIPTKILLHPDDLSLFSNRFCILLSQHTRATSLGTQLCSQLCHWTAQNKTSSQHTRKVKISYWAPFQSCYLSRRPRVSTKLLPKIWTCFHRLTGSSIKMFLCGKAWQLSFPKGAYSSPLTSGSDDSQTNFFLFVTGSSLIIFPSFTIFKFFLYISLSLIEKKTSHTVSLSLFFPMLSVSGYCSWGSTTWPHAHHHYTCISRAKEEAVQGVFQEGRSPFPCHQQQSIGLKTKATLQKTPMQLMTAT